MPINTMQPTAHPKAAALLCLAVGLLGAQSAAWAQMRPQTSTLKLGLGLVASDEGYKGLGIKTTVIPALAVQTPRFSLRGTSAELVVTNPENTNFSVNLRADLLMQGYKASDATIFNGMSSRKPSLLLGVGAKAATPVGQVWLEAGADATGNSKGFRTELGIGWRAALGDWTFTPYVSAQHNSAKLVNYYYGVTPAEAAANRPAYDAGAATNFNLGVSASTDISPSLSLVLGARYRAYGSSIRQSPLIDSAGSVSGTASLLYRLY